MTEYVVELYEKGAKKPYQRFKGTMPNGLRPTLTNSEIVFNNQLNDVYKARIYYASNSKLIAETWTDKNGIKRIRWKHY